MVYVSDRQSSILAELEALLPRLQKFAAALTGNRNAASDLVKATCQTVLARAAREKGQTSLAVWAYSQMHTQWMARIATRGRPRREDVDAELFHAALNSQPPNVFTAGLAKLISNLPPQQRGTLILVYGAGLSYDEAAEVFGVQVGTVMTRLVRSHRALAHWLEHRGLRAADDAAYAPRGADAGHAMAFEPDGIYERYREERAA